MKELENGKKKLLITGMILIIIAVCAAGIFAYGSHKNNQNIKKYPNKSNLFSV